jgi:hypothetical protein
LRGSKAVFSEYDDWYRDESRGFERGNRVRLGIGIARQRVRVDDR